MAALPALAQAQTDTHDYPSCTRSPTTADIAAAKSAFQVGNTSFDEADYPRSIVYWEDAYRRDCTAHALLLNLARAYELSGQKAQAAIALQTYLERVPAAPDKDKIQRRIDALRTATPSESSETPPAPPATATATAPIAAPETPPAPATPAVAPEEITPGPRPIWPLFVSGVGAVATAVGGVLYFTAVSDLNQFNKKCPLDKTSGDRICPKDEPNLADNANSAGSRQRIGGALAIGGLALVAGGIVWYVVGPRPSVSHSISGQREIVPLLGPGLVGVGYSARF